MAASAPDFPKPRRRRLVPTIPLDPALLDDLTSALDSNSSAVPNAKKARGDGLSKRVKARIRFAMKGEIVRMTMRGKFSPSEDLKSELMGIGGGVKDWKAEFESMREYLTKAALEKIGDIEEYFDDSFIRKVILQVASPGGDWGGDEDIVGMFRCILDENNQSFFAYIRALCCQYSELVDDSVEAILARPGKETVLNDKLSILTAWHEAMMEKRSSDLSEWEAFGLFRHYQGELDKDWVIAIGLSSLKEIIQDDVWAEIRRRRMTEIKNGLPGLCLRSDEAETVYYIAGAILHRARKHYNRKDFTESARAAVAISFLNFNSIGQDSASAENLPIGLVRDREKVNLVYVSAKFFRWVVALEANFGSNCTRANVEAYNSELFSECEKKACHNENLFRAFLDAAPLELLSFGEDPDAAEESSEKYRNLFCSLIKKYRKVRQADFFDSLNCMKYKPDESLRRNLKSISDPKRAAAPVKAGAAEGEAPAKAVGAEDETELGLELPYEEGPFAGDTASDSEDSESDGRGEMD
jgi:hypothetical protein